MKNDAQIQKEVMDELAWEPFLDSSEIGVAVKNGVVTLSGRVDSYAKKLTAEKAAKSIAGVKSVTEDIQVGVSPKMKNHFFVLGTNKSFH
jgi:osmotically-inducible protein OsmY